MRLLFLVVLLVAASAWAQSPPAWVQKSNQNAQLLIAIMARYAPEQAAAEGVQGLDEQVSSSKPDEPERFRKDLAAARDELERRRAGTGREVHLIGIAPLTSMFLYSGIDRSRIDDFRPAVHDSDGLAIANGGGEHIWRPLTNPRRLQISVFSVREVRGFGLIQ